MAAKDSQPSVPEFTLGTGWVVVVVGVAGTVVAAPADPNMAPNHQEATQRIAALQTSFSTSRLLTESKISIDPPVPLVDPRSIRRNANQRLDFTPPVIDLAEHRPIGTLPPKR
jgi:hypothetical protein